MLIDHRTGDISGLEHIDALVGYALILTRNRADAEDLVQDTYVKALAAMDTLRNRQSLKSWMFRILRNLWLNQLRDGRHQSRRVDLEEAVEYEELHSLSGPGDPHEAYVRTQERKIVSKVLSQLSLGNRELIVLREYEGMSYQELAAILNCPIGTVMSRLYRARSAFRTLLPQEWVENRLPQEEGQ